MARFLAAIQGARGEATRLGGESSGIRAQAQGWNIGVKVYGRVDSETGRDEFFIYATSGSSGGTEFQIGSVYLDEDYNPRFVAS